MLVPTTFYVAPEKLPEHAALKRDQMETAQACARNFRDGGNGRCSRPARWLLPAEENLYYRTDHHWTVGSVPGYRVSVKMDCLNPLEKLVRRW